ncbi:MAG: T9SS C-terminal target domain-containing protein [Bacteroidetes bacterium]|nr:MAG: T9SS C-terminal target domain-containing protein [Bacteroidota bacterium]
MRISCKVELSKLRFGAILLLWLWCASSLAQEVRSTASLPLLPLSEIPDSAFFAGAVAVKFKAHITHLQNQTTLKDGKVQFAIPILDRLSNKFGIYQCKWLYASVFANAEQTEKLEAVANMQRAGLQQWFYLHYSANLPVPDAIAALLATNLVEVAEPIFKIKQWWTPNDERFANQWHYQNTGQSGGSPGADIKLPEAWDIETGKPNVLVAVHDAGINTSHPDLQPNMWPELGYNFVTDTDILQPDQHATHVAGIVAAASNNGLGISGVAGGNGTPQSGARLMSMQIIGSGNPSIGYEALSFVFAANNGAAISQNSWSYTVPNVMPAATREAIDFFMAYGGGTVIRGGLVIFAAGNDNSSRPFFPGAYPPVLTVAATNNFDQRSSYSSYGSFVDLCAPGGDFRQGPNAAVLSTGLGSSYVYMQGTSMACPHVSGVAALIASHVPGRLLASDVAAILRITADNVAPKNPGFEQALGAGRLNAYRALQYAQAIAKAPLVAAPTNLTTAAVCSTLQIGWTVSAPNTQTMVVYNNADNLGFPNGGNYQAGDTIPGGGLVIYVGTASQFTYPMAIDGTTMSFAVYANPIGTNYYSDAQQIRLLVPQTVANPQAAPANTSIAMQWQRQCPNRGVLVAWSTTGNFGTPRGNPEQVANILGGGTALTNGTNLTFLHSGLLPDQQYFYAFYSYMNLNGVFVYSQPLIVPTATSCPQTDSLAPQSFSETDFPPTGWRLYDGGANGSLVGEGRTWKRYDGIGSRSGDGASAYVRAYAENGNNSKETLRSQQLIVPKNIDSLVLSFDYAYQMYSNDAGFIDSLELAVSNNCGITLTSLWKAGGAELATVEGFETNEFFPADPTQWRTVRINLTAEAQRMGLISLLFRATNRFGQNIFLDNIDVQTFKKPVYDAELAALLQPSASLQCTNSISPKIRLRNTGNAVLDSVAVYWQYANLAPDRVWLKNLGLMPGKDSVIALDPKNIPTGNYGFNMWCSLPGRTPDANPANDSVQLQLSVMGSNATPFTETFEGGGSMPAGWGNLNPDGGLTWTQRQTAAYNGTGSMVMPNFSYTNTGATDWLVSPTLSAPTLSIDSLLLTFYLAAAARSSARFDTLEVAFTNNCGQSFTPLLKLWGSSLQTLGPTNPDFSTNFVPTRRQWRQQRINLTPYTTALAGGYQLAFKNTSLGGNNIYVDDVQVFSKTLPASLKSNGFELYPNPALEAAVLHFYQPPAGLSAVVVYSALGQKLWQQSYGAATAPQLIHLNLRGLAAGVYWVQLQYAGSTITRRLLKQTP